MTIPLRVLHLTDCHLQADKSALMVGLNIQESFTAVLAAATKVIPDPDLVIVTGDLSHDHEKADYLVTYTYLAKTLKKHYRKSVCIPGNHDDAGLVKRIFPFYDIETEGAIKLNNWQIILLDSAQKDNPAGWLADSELALLDRSLPEAETSDRDNYNLIAIHHPVIALNSEWLDQQMVGNAEQFFSVLARKKHIQGVVCGHAHQAYDSVVNNIKIMGTPATCPRQFAPLAKDFSVDDTGPGFRSLTLHPTGEIETQIHRL